MVRSWVAEGDHEVWLWVGGDRHWAQVIDGLGGRIARRATSIPENKTPPS
jgi:hypothetical protein